MVEGWFGGRFRQIILFPTRFHAHTLSGVTLLHLAAEFNERDVVDHLLDRGADLNATAELDDRGIGSQTPLFHVIGNN